MNHVVSVPRSYFTKTAVRDYSYPAQALVREFLQNSRDADSTRIEFQISKPDQNFVLTVRDNGCGMNEEVIRDKLMALGESTKDSSNGQVGGFGIAKILLFFAHESYTIRTRDLLVEGVGGVYRIAKTDTYYNGVEATVILSNEVMKHLSSVDSVVVLFRTEIAKSYLPNINITVQGEQIEAERKKGRSVEELSPDLTLYKKLSDQTKYYGSLRVNGLHMFEFYLGESKHELIIELTGYSIEYLTTNRDGLRGDWRHKIEKACQEYILNSSKGSKSKIRLFKGELSRYSETTLTTVIENLNENISAALSFGEPHKIDSIFNEAKEQSPDLVEAIEKLYAITKNKVDNREYWLPLTIKDAGLVHHYFVETRGNYRKLPPKWEPGNFRASQKTVLELWSKILQMVLADAGKFGTEFNVGYVLDDGSEGDVVLANFREREDKSFLFLLNPKKYGDEKRLPIHRKRRLELILWLLNLAIHEVTHALGSDLHNENFIKTENYLKAKVFLRIKEYLKLREIY